MKLDLNLFPKAVFAIISNGSSTYRIVSYTGYSPIRMRVELPNKGKFYKRFDDPRLATVEALKYVNQKINKEDYGIEYITFTYDNGESHTLSTSEFESLMEQISHSEHAQIVYDPLNTSHRKKVVEACEKGDREALEYFIANGLDLTRGLIDARVKYSYSPSAFAEYAGNTEMKEFIEAKIAEAEAQDEKTAAETKVREKLNDAYLAKIRQEAKECKEKAEVEAQKKIRKGDKLNKIAEITIEGSELSHEPITHLWDNVVGFIGDEPYKDKLDIIDYATGQILWRIDDQSIWQSNTYPVYDGKFVYAVIEPSMSGGMKVISAHEPLTGKEVWRCSLSSATAQFGTPMVMTDNHIAVVNTDNNKMTIIEKPKDKGKAKVISRAKMPHKMREGYGELFAWNDKFVALALDKRNTIVTVDLFDPTQKEPFVETLVELTDYDPLRHRLVGDHLFITTYEGYLIKINLADKEVIKCGHPNEKVYLERNTKETFDYYNYSKKIDLSDHKLYYIAERDKECHICVYDLTTGSFETIPVTKQEAESRSKISNGHVVTIIDERITIYDIKNRKVVAYKDEEFKKIEKWTLVGNHIIGGNRIGTYRETGNSHLRVWEF